MLRLAGFAEASPTATVGARRSLWRSRDPGIHQKKSFFRSAMDARVKPAHDELSKDYVA